MRTPQLSSRAAVACQATQSAPPATPAPVTADAANPASSKPTHVINVIPNNGVWRPSGIPPVMGAHLMASGVVAPITTSKGPGLDVAVHEFQYHEAETEVSIVLHATQAVAVNAVTRAVTEASEAAIKEKGSFTVALSGGSLSSQLAPLANAKGVQWDKFHVFWADERNVPLDHEDSNARQVTETLLGKVGIPAAQIHKIQEGLPVDKAAVQYEGQLLSTPRSVLPVNKDGLPVIDLILLGVGPDGHTASLFPNRKEVAITDKWVLPVSNSPKPPPERITLSLPVLNAAKDVIYVALGESKAEIVQRVLEVQALPGALPSQLVRPKGGKLKWLLDVSSAQNLDIAAWEDKKKFPRSVL